MSNGDYKKLVDYAVRESLDAFSHKFFFVNEPATLFEWNWHIGCIAEHLEAVYRGEIKRLIINEPPRTLKSYLVSQAFPAWVLGRDPHERFIVTSYSHTLAENLSMRCKNILKSEEYQRIFPETQVSTITDTKSYWLTSKQGQYYSISALGQITGIGCNYMIIDDPIKPAEAVSSVRESTNFNIRNTLFSRLDDKRTGRIVMVMQRLHDDDPTGHFLKDGGWTHLKLPAENKKSDIHIILNDKKWTMKQGELLLPNRLSREILDQTQTDMGSYSYAGQYLQEPLPIGGEEFLSTWPKYYEHGQVAYKTMKVFILVDPAGGEDLNKKKKKSSDWTAMMVVGLAPDNNYYLLDIVRERLNPTERLDKLFELHRDYNTLCGRPPKVGYERYSIQADVHYINKRMAEDAYRFPLVELAGRIAKEERIRRLIPDLEAGRWWFPSKIMYTDKEGRTFNLVQELISGEMGSFPKARFDDMLDAMSRIYDEELGATFPAQTLSKSAQAMKRNTQIEYQSWEDF